jgi:drug/metabolite transporter superfamily protein YnfA
VNRPLQRSSDVSRVIDARYQGGIFICASLAWLRSVEGIRPDQWDLTGAAICIIATMIIRLGPRTA